MSAARPVADVIEDAEFLDSSGTGAIDAARRLDFPTPSAFEKWLERHGRSDLWQRMKARDPEGWHWQARRGQMQTTSNAGDTIAALIHRGKESPRKAVRRKAERVEEAVVALRSALDADDEAEKARKEVERLERQLKEARARLRGGAVFTQDGPSAAEIREWALANSVPCPAMGRVPASVRAAYEAAQEAGAA